MVEHILLSDSHGYSVTVSRELLPTQQFEMLLSDVDVEGDTLEYAVSVSEPGHLEQLVTFIQENEGDLVYPQDDETQEEYEKRVGECTLEPLYDLAADNYATGTLAQFIQLVTSLGLFQIYSTLVRWTADQLNSRDMEEFLRQGNLI